MSTARNFTVDALFDPAVRRAIIDDPCAYAQQAGVDVTGKEVVVVKCRADVWYVAVHRPAEEVDLSAEQLRTLAAAGNTPVGTAGSLGTVGTLCSTYSSAGTVGTAGCG